MYFYSKEDLENLADNINKELYPERLGKIIPFDAYDYMEKQGLEIEWKYISPNKKLLGMIFFDDGKWPVWNNGKYKSGDIPHIENFKKGTVVINNILIDEKDIKKERFVSGHEAMHWAKDENYFRTHTTDIIHACKEDTFENTFWNIKMSEIDVIERQTNYLNAAVQMPRELIKREFFKRLRYKNIPNSPIEYKKYMKACIRSLANDFGLNYNPVLYRLYDLNILKRERNDVIGTKK